ncbi:MGDG synthase family glycosyltransferase [Methylacidiphilum caldifontis]|uniref:Galactosyldiacylglycerol synthase n=1 Tax=Methylacidiphilum caldifontis TaxID=2795386 RepID=A0A4Y8PA53_9BACT|nr:glycosyltransferase [Methylacidiphilum caldifontis]QSR89064.1 glycosyltransferase [Methylacidiphilum caldifontis]TFE67411.1 galactosyldiacylglycerol synthase [Methylacidiphilum caldifontis]
MAEKIRVLILSTSAGTGHIRAAEALEKVFFEDSRVGQVECVDALKYTNKIFRDFYSKLYIQLVDTAPTFLGWWYRTTDEPWKTDKMRFMLDRLNTQPLIDFISAYSPHVTVCTHFLPAEIISYLISQKKIDCRLSIVVTDFHCHAMWLCRVFHRYFVANEESKIHLINLGIPAERIVFSGIPIDPVFKPSKNKKEQKKNMGFDPETPVILVSAGALSVSPVEVILESLETLKMPLQIVVVCGKNVQMEEKIRIQASKLSNHSIQVYGFTTEMHKFMDVADILIGKPGGLTASEAMAMGLPMIIISPIPGQEEFNSDFLLEKGVAIKCNEFTTLAYKVHYLLSHPHILKQMQKNALKQGKADAAYTIVKILLDDELNPPMPVCLNPEQKERI